MKKSLKIALFVWVLTTSALMSFLMSTHMGVFKTQRSEVIAQNEKLGKKVFHHFLYAGCGCSREVSKRLTTLSKNQNEKHIVYWIEDGQFEAPQFPGHVELKTIGLDSPILDRINGAPLLQVEENQKVIYLGGYSHAKTTFLTDWVVDKIQQNRTPASAPVRGCYVAKQKSHWLSKLWTYLI